MSNVVLFDVFSVEVNGIIGIFTVMWSETASLRTRLVGKKTVLVLHTAVLVLVLQVWCCVVKHGHARCHNDLEGHGNFSSTIYGFSILVLEHHYCGDQQWRSLT